MCVCVFIHKYIYINVYIDSAAMQVSWHFKKGQRVAHRDFQLESWSAAHEVAHPPEKKKA